MTLGLRPRAIMAALRPTPRPYHYKQLLTYKYWSRLGPLVVPHMEKRQLESTFTDVKNIYIHWYSNLGSKIPSQSSDKMKKTLNIKVKSDEYPYPYITLPNISKAAQKL